MNSESNGVNKPSFSRKLFSPQDFNHHSGGGAAQVLSAGKSNEKLMDRFIPCRMGENLQAKFEAVSQKNEEEFKYNNSRLVNNLGLNGD